MQQLIKARRHAPSSHGMIGFVYPPWFATEQMLLQWDRMARAAGMPMLVVFDFFGQQSGSFPTNDTLITAIKAFADLAKQRYPDTVKVVSYYILTAGVSSLICAQNPPWLPYGRNGQPLIEDRGVG